MAITFASARYLSTANVAHMFYNVPVASQSFKIRVESASPPSIPGTVNVLRRNIFDFIHSFWATPTSTANLNLQLNGVGGAVQINVALTIGTVYVICLVWDGTTGVQTCYVSGVPRVMGHLSGLTSNRVDPIQIGPLAAETAIVYSLGDCNAWDNYALTQADASALTSNGDPTTIGTGASWRCRWTLDGTTGAAAAIGDAGLKNAYGLGADFASVAGTGTAIYAPPLVWAPTVTAHPYVAGCGKVIAATLTLNTDGSPVAATQLLTTPAITVNGVNLGPLEKPWLTGVHQCIFYGTPGAVMINPGDVVKLTAPTAWAVTPAGPVAALDGTATIVNLRGRSSVGADADTMTRTLRVGTNNAGTSGLEYYPFLNARLQMVTAYGFSKMNPGNGYQIVNQPCEAGKILIVWDATKPATPAIMSAQSNHPSRVTVTHDATLDVTPPLTGPGAGVGFVRAYDVAYVPGSDYKTAAGGSGIGLNYTDPAFTGTPNYDNLWIYLAGEWDVVDGVAVFDRSDTFALSRIYKDRVRNDIGSMRAVDSTACGGSCPSYPYPELLLSSGFQLQWGGAAIRRPNVGFTSLGPVDVTAHPYVYSGLFKQSYQTYTATLTDTISTAPAVGTHETWHFSDGATAPLMAGLEGKVDNEEFRVISGSGTDWVVYRGSNGTTPATHSPGVVTIYGRQLITKIVASDGTYPYAAPALIQCSIPHGLTTTMGYTPIGATGAITMADGTVAASYNFGNFYATGPDTFMSILFGLYPSKPHGTKPSRTYTLNPTVNYAFLQYFPGMPIDVYCNLVSRFPRANLHINIPLDAVDDMAWTYARICRDNFPAGRKIYVEWANEPWNFAYPFRAYSYCTQFEYGLLDPSLNQLHDYRDYYIYRATQVHAIFRSVFRDAGRLGELVCLANVQPNSGASQVTPYLNAALAFGQPLDAIAPAAYFSLGQSGNGLGGPTGTVAAFNSYDDDQAAEMLLHDLVYDPLGTVGFMKNVKAAIDAYNHSNSKNCVLMLYEGNLEWAAPPGATHHDERSHDIQYNPNIKGVEDGLRKICQDNGVTAFHTYCGVGMAWGAPSWGNYHARTQKHSLGDGLNGAFDNRSVTITPGTPGYIGIPGAQAYLPQDITVDSPRGHAAILWNASVGVAVATTYTLTAPTPNSGIVNTASGPFLVAPNGPYTGTVTITPSGGGLSTPIVLTFSSSSTPQTFTITPTVAGTVTLTPTNSGGLSDAGAVTYQALSANATSYSFVGPSPSTGEVNTASGNFTVQPNGLYTGSVTIMLAMGGLSGPVVLTWAGTFEAQSFTITPTVAGTVTLTPSSSPALTDPSFLTYTATAPPPSSTAKFILVRKVITNAASPTGH